ncbi:Glucosidase 2 subunit beta [Amphibalanus amphitrite]|uniref:Glucosidase 2 subunit beta n=1 Tax=Amphibalanus amphitrite TaxID=1232801 RepID=A0A6A4WER7_AMPAM|nr:Glucosidase 2 subunit beta [Amphibalanus amphitrite]
MMAHRTLSALLLALAGLAAGAGADLALPRGVSMAKASLYQAGDTFTCLDGSATIQFQYVNDDYCDCEDGSDEPGTSACAVGSFYCANRGHAAAEVPSAWVNDGVCDCCDGSDEYASGACPNTCDEIGAAARARQQQIDEMRLRGYEVKLKLIEEGKEKLAEKQVRLAELNREKEVAEEMKNAREAAKNEAEAQERLLLDAWHEQRRQQEQEHEEANRQLAEETFTRLDVNSDGKLTTEELQREPKLDKDADGVVSKDEVDSITMNKDELEMEEFVVSTWPLLKPFFHPLHVPEEGGQPTGAPAAAPDQQQQEVAEGEELTEEELAAGEVDAGDLVTPGAGTVQELDRDEVRTAAAKQARAELQEAEQKLRDIEREVGGVESFTGLDLGPEKAFAALYQQCFTLENREYEYKLCVFDKATQKPRSGGVETSLGKWDSWERPEQTGYTQQLYNNGQQCWNGPKRSAHVTFACGEETRVLDVTEPAKCEYKFSLETPAVCERPSAEGEQLFHDEL